MKVPERYRAGIARYTADDADDLLEFQLRMFQPGSRQVDAARAGWLYDDNPYRTDRQARDVWVCRRDGKVVGQQAQIPFDLQVGDQVRRAAWGIDLMVDPGWRLKGVGPGLLSTLRGAHTIVLGLNRSEKGYANVVRDGWTDLGIVPVYLRPLDLSRAARSSGVGPRLARVAPVAGPVLRALDATATASLRVVGARLVAVDRFDERADEVWQAAATHYPVLAHRDLRAVHWRIDQRPDRDHLSRYYLVVRGRSVGYVVLRPAGTADAPSVIVVDYLAPPRWVAPLLVAAGRAARRGGAVAMSVKTRNVQADRALRAAGFVCRERGSDDPIRFVVTCADDEDTTARVCDPDAWFVTSADSDLEYATAPAAVPVVP
ncbi:MAG: GNAT family N-acetyltransferase [Acidimicrobiales bacterium]